MKHREIISVLAMNHLGLSNIYTDSSTKRNQHQILQACSRNNLNDQIRQINSPLLKILSLIHLTYSYQNRILPLLINAGFRLQSDMDVSISRQTMASKFFWANNGIKCINSNLILGSLMQLLMYLRLLSIVSSQAFNFLEFILAKTLSKPEQAGLRRSLLSIFSYIQSLYSTCIIGTYAPTLFLVPNIATDSVKKNKKKVIKYKSYIVTGIVELTIGTLIPQYMNNQFQVQEQMFQCRNRAFQSRNSEFQYHVRTSSVGT